MLNAFACGEAVDTLQQLRRAQSLAVLLATRRGRCDDDDVELECILNEDLYIPLPEQFSPVSHLITNNMQFRLNKRNDLTGLSSTTVI